MHGFQQRSPASRSTAVLMLACVLAFLPRLTLAQCPGGTTGTWTVSPAQRYAGPSGGVYAMLPFDPDGAGPEPVSLIVGGYFSLVSDFVANRVCFWNGTAWRPMGVGFNGGVEALITFNNELYAAGRFTFSGGTPCNRIARWNGSAWVPLGTGLNGDVLALAVYNNRLYAAGAFTLAGGLPANAVASWDGAIWRPLGSGIPGGGVTNSPSNAVGLVNAMAVFDARLYIGGRFDRANGASERATLVTWDGTSFGSPATFTHTGDFVPIPEILSMAVFTSSAQATSTLYIGGDFDTVNGAAARFIASYRKTITTEGPWMPVGTTIGGPVERLLLQTNLSGVTGIIAACSERPFDDSPWLLGTYRFASGTWNLYSPERALSLANFTGGVHAGVRGCSIRAGSEWLPLGPGVNGTPNRFASAGPGGDLYMAGNFTVADQQNVNGIARLDAAGWHPVGIGVLNSTPAGLDSISDMVVHAGSVFVSGGYLPSGGGNYAARVLRWNGSAWSSVFNGTAGSSARFSIVEGTLYMCHVHVYRWTGVSFAQVGGAIPNNGGPNAVVMFQGALHATGERLYRLDGSAWVVAANLRNFYSANTPVVWNGRLFAQMSTQGPGSIDELVNGEFVERLPNYYASDMRTIDGALYAVSSLGLITFDGSSWTPLSNGGGTQVFKHDGRLMIGTTTVIDGVVSPLFAALTCCLADFDRSGSVTPQDIFEFLNAWFMGQSGADINGGGLAPSDIFDFLNAWFAGC